MTAPKNPSAYTYYIDHTKYSWKIAAYVGSSCPYSETLTITPSVSWITLFESTRTVEVYTTNTDLHNTEETFTVTSILGNGSSNNSYTFHITLKNPCILTAPPNPSAYTYYIDSLEYSWTLDEYFSDTNCEATETLTISPSREWISID